MGTCKDKGRSVAADLRNQAEDQAGKNTDERDFPSSVEDSMRLVHELEVHQIELEMQNDELSQKRQELELSRNTYAELYDFAPVGYFTIDARGMICDVNHTGSHMLGLEKGVLVNKPFNSMIADEDGREIFTNHLAYVVQRNTILKCEIRLKSSAGSILHCQLQSVSVAIENKAGFILTSIVDNTVRKHLEDEVRKAYDNLEETVHNRTKELTERTEELKKSNVRLTHEIEERKKAEKSLQSAYSEIKLLKDRLQAENIYLQDEISRQYNFGDIIGKSDVLMRVFSQVEQVAPMNATVLLLGETGTGKGVVARAIHSNSVRKARPLIIVNCTTLPATLVESELFGRERGAFTGSDARQIGRFELADGGTIFLDEIGEMPMELQSKLLRVIQDGEFERLGSPRTIKTDVRIIAASNRNLQEEVRNGRFREDLFYRLNVFPITVPPLRQRKEDIPLLVNHFVDKFNKKTGKKIKTVSKDALNTLQKYNWPGNVRELESIIERAVIISQGTALQIVDRFDTSGRKDEPAGQDFKALVDLEHDHILQVLQKTGWRIEGEKGAAGLLGLNASTLRARMRKYGIVRV